MRKKRGGDKKEKKKRRPPIPRLAFIFRLCLLEGAKHEVANHTLYEGCSRQICVAFLVCPCISFATECKFVCVAEHAASRVKQ